jgi:hypothetical protein
MKEKEGMIIANVARLVFWVLINMTRIIVVFNPNLQAYPTKFIFAHLTLHMITTLVTLNDNVTIRTCLSVVVNPFSILGFFRSLTFPFFELGTGKRHVSFDVTTSKALSFIVV